MKPKHEFSAFVEQFLSRSALRMPDRLVPTGWAQHGPFAFWLVEALKPATVVELGTHRGYSYCAFCQAVLGLELGSTCWAVDTWMGDEHAGHYDEQVYAELKAYHDPRYRHFSQLIRSTFSDAVAHFSDGTIDLLHIDGRHFYADVKEDYETWLPKVSQSGVVLFHDTNVRERGFGVFEFWEELRAEHPHFQFNHGHGLGVLGVGANIPRAVMRLFDAGRDPALTREIRDVYARLGAAIDDRIQLDAATASIRQLEQDIRDLHYALSQQQKGEQEREAAHPPIVVAEAPGRPDPSVATREAIERSLDLLHPRGPARRLRAVA